MNRGRREVPLYLFRVQSGIIVEEILLQSRSSSVGRLGKGSNAGGPPLFPVGLRKHAAWVHAWSPLGHSAHVRHWREDSARWVLLNSRRLLVGKVDGIHGRWGSDPRVCVHESIQFW